MKIPTFTILAVVFLLLSCNNQTKDNAASLANKNSENYKGPIIDMHIHAYTDGNPLLGKTHPPTLRGETIYKWNCRIDANIFYTS